MTMRNGCTAFVLKLTAIIGMTACHVGAVFGDRLPFAWSCVLTAAGGATFPIMAFLVSEGYRRTSSIRRYAARLGACAIVSQVPYSLVFEPLVMDLGAGEFQLPFTGNVLFTLLLGLGLLCAYDRMANRRAFWVLFAAATAASAVLDWGVLGPVMILAAHVLPDGWQRRVLPALVPVVAMGLPAAAEVFGGSLSSLPELLYEAVGGMSAVALLYQYNGRRGIPLKWFFYAYYPAHLALLGAVSALL